MSKCELFVGLIPIDVNEAELKAYFDSCCTKNGSVRAVRIKGPRVTGSRRYGFLVLANKDAKEEVMHSRPHSIRGKQLTVALPSSRSKRRGRPNFYSFEVHSAENHRNDMASNAAGLLEPTINPSGDADVRMTKPTSIKIDQKISTHNEGLPANSSAFARPLSPDTNIGDKDEASTSGTAEEEWVRATVPLFSPSFYRRTVEKHRSGAAQASTPSDSTVVSGYSEEGRISSEPRRCDSQMDLEAELGHMVVERDTNRLCANVQRVDVGVQQAQCDFVNTVMDDDEIFQLIARKYPQMLRRLFVERGNH